MDIRDMFNEESVGALADAVAVSGPPAEAVFDRQALEAHHPDLVEPYRRLAANRRPYHAALVERTRRLAARHGLAWREVRIIYGRSEP